MFHIRDEHNSCIIAAVSGKGAMIVHDPIIVDSIFVSIIPI